MTMNHDIITRIAKALPGHVITTRTELDEEELKLRFDISLKDIRVQSETPENALDQFIQRLQMASLTRVEHAAIDRALGQDEEAAEEAERQWRLDVCAERKRTEDRHMIPGVRDLETFFGNEVIFDQDMDEDGPSGLFSAAIVIGGMGATRALGKTEAEAVKALRRQVVSQLRVVAEDLEQPVED